MRNRPPADKFFVPILAYQLTAVLARSRTLSRRLRRLPTAIPDCRCARRCAGGIGTGNIKAALRAGSKRPAARIEQGTDF